jgi:hypothetical protein
MNVIKKVDKKTPILDDKKYNKEFNEPVVKRGIKEVLGQVLKFVIVGGDFV